MGPIKATITTMPIRLRLALLCTTLVLVVLGAGGVLFTNVLHADLLRELDAELHSRADAVSSALRAGAPPAAETSQAVGPQDVFIQLVDSGGNVVAASSVAVSESLLSSTQLGDAAASASPVEIALAQHPNGELTPDRLRMVVATTRAQRVRYVVVAGTLDPVGDALGDVTTELLITAALVVPLAGLGAWAVAGAALRPVERLRRDVARISDRDAESRVRSPNTRDELARLADTMNRLLSRLQAALARERRLVADAAHELRTPLAILRTELELAGRRERTREELVEAVAGAAQETDRLVRLAADLLFLARTDEGAPVLRLEPQIVREVVDEAVRTHAGRAAEAGVSLGVTGGEDLVVLLDEVRIRQAVENLVDNAVRMAPGGSSVSVAVQVDDGVTEISVSDSGPGFPEEFLAHAFERFRRADTSRARNGGGAGLGLAIVDAIARAHGGRAEARNRPEGGATVTLTIPLGTPDEEVAS